MAWTAPSTFVAGAILTAAQLNTNVRDNTLAGGPIYATTAARDAAIPTPFAGQRAFVSGTNVNYQYNGTAWVSPQALSVPPMVRLTGPAGTAYTSANDVSWNTTPAYDTNGMFASGSPTRITIATAGVYLVVAQFRPTFGGTNTDIEARIKVDGTQAAWQENPGISNSLGGCWAQVSLVTSLTATQYLTASINLVGATGILMNTASWFSATFMGKTA